MKTLRFGDLKKGKGKFVRCSYAKIAKALGISHNQAVHLSRFKSHVSKKTYWDRRMRQLDASHCAYLLNSDILRQWAGFSLKERVALFQRKFPHKKMSATALGKFYAKHGVKMKRVVLEKRKTPKAWRNYFNDVAALKS